MSTQELNYEQRVAVARLHALLELLPTALDKELVPAGITSFEFTLLEALNEADRHRLRLSALASRTNATLARLSRVVTSLEGKGLVVRMPCEEDGRATNAVLTDEGLNLYRESAPLYADAVQRMILSGLDDAGVEQLAALSLSILWKLDPDRRLAITTTESGTTCAADPTGRDEPVCAADPAAQEDSEPAYAADPVPQEDSEPVCAADPVR